MNQLSKELERYLVIRRSLGFDLSTTATILKRFVDFAEQQGADHISTDLFLRWKKAFGHANQQTWVGYLGIVRIFAQWLHGLDPSNEVPPKGLIPCRLRRPKPYIYSEEEIRKIIETADGLPSKSGMRALTHSTLFGLLAATGLRINEALALNNADVDLAHGVLTIRRGKGGKARLVPVTDSVISHLNFYIGERDRLLGFVPQSFFVKESGTRLNGGRARYDFSTVCQRIGLRPVLKPRYGRHGRGPRIHDLRHTFAVRTLIGWYRTGKDPSREMHKLTTYLGHWNPEHTYWYIESVPELLELASQRVTGSSTKEVR